MRASRLCLLCLILAGLAGCSDNGNGEKDSGPAGDLSPAVGDGFGPLYKCSNPGGPCEAHNACVMAATCGEDGYCHPTKVQDCNDGLDCTQDLCKGLGQCLNVPKTDTCALPVKVVKDGKTVTELRCFKKDDRNPEDACLVCNPDPEKEGSATEWSLANGGSCDDGNPCTKDDYCQSGVCKGDDFSKLCADEYTCTEDICDGKGGCGTEHKLLPDWCLIKEGTKSVCYKDQQQDSTGCNICDVKKSQTSWTPLSVHCLIDKICYKPGAKDSTGCGVCDPAKDPNGWTPLPGLCKIGTVCYQAGALHPKGCAECDPATSTTAWTVKGNDCLISDKCYKPGDKDSTGCATCDPTKSKTDWSPVSNMCKIGTSCYASGAKHPQGCAECDPAASATAWTVNTNNCLISNTCYAPGAKDTLGCSQCDPTKSKTDWSPVPNTCKISGKCYASGTKDPTGCAECDPAVSATAWTVKTANCLIAGTCYTSGQNDTSGCGVCDPTKNKYDWSTVAGKCKIGESCYANLAKDSTGCLMCDVAKNPTGWTPVPGVSSTAYTFDDGKSPPTGWTITNSDSSVGWVVCNRRSVSGSYSLYYGDPAVGDYDTGSDNNGTAKMPPIALTAGKKAGLSFWLYIDTEESSSFDTLEVVVNGKVLWSKTSSTPQMSWHEVTVDLSSYAGQSITIEFKFDTQDSISNDTEGVFIDSVNVYHNC
jgi:hypothetical protein